MLFLEGNMQGLGILILAVALYWLSILIILIMGLVRLKSKPKSAKKMLILAGIMFLVGAGFCGMM